MPKATIIQTFLRLVDTSARDGVNCTYPNFFVVGAEKAGTTSLYHYLRAHPDIYMSPIKEPNYFAKDLDITKYSSDYKKTVLSDYRRYIKNGMQTIEHIAYVKDWEDYLQLYSRCSSEKVVGESSNAYLYSTCAAFEIWRRLPDAKILMVLRNPIERAFSQYLMDCRIGLTNDSFRVLVDKELENVERNEKNERSYIAHGMYFDQVNRYLSVFPRNKVGIYLYDDFKSRTKELLKDILVFLDVEQDAVPDLIVKYNEARSPRFDRMNRVLFRTGFKKYLRKLTPPRMRSEVKKLLYTTKIPVIDSADYAMLADVFCEDIRRLGKLIDADLQHWLS